MATPMGLPLVFDPASSVLGKAAGRVIYRRRDQRRFCHGEVAGNVNLYAVVADVTVDVLQSNDAYFVRRSVLAEGVASPPGIVVGGIPRDRLAVSTRSGTTMTA